MSEKPDYSKYTLNELYDILQHIDKALYPDRVKFIKSEINKRAPNLIKSENISIEAKSNLSISHKKQYSQKKDIKLKLANGTIRHNPTFDVIEKEVLSLSASNPSAILSENSKSYIRANKSNVGGFYLEYKEHSKSSRFRSIIDSLSIEFIVEIFQIYTLSESNWKDKMEWVIIPKTKSQSKIESLMDKAKWFLGLPLLSIFLLYRDKLSNIIINYFEEKDIEFEYPMLVLGLIFVLIYRKKIRYFNKLGCREQIYTFSAVLLFITALLLLIFK